MKQELIAIVERIWNSTLFIPLSVFSVISAYLILVLALNPDVIRADQWRYVYLVLQPIYESGFNVFHLARDHSSHVKLLYKAIFFGNAMIFDLRMNVEILIGMTCLGIFAVLVIRNLGQALDLNQWRWYPLAVVLLIFPVLFSFNRWPSYTYSLVTVGVYGGWLAFFLYWNKIEQIMRNGPARFDFVWLFVLMVVVTLGIGGGRNPAVILTGLLMSVSGLVLFPERRKFNSGLALVILLFAVLLQFAYWNLVSLTAGPTFLQNGWQRISADPLGAIEYTLILLANSDLYYRLLRPRDVNSWIVLGFGATIFIIYLAGIYLYFKHQLYRKTLLPMVFIVFTGILIAQLVYGRFGLRFGFPHRSSFANNPQLGLIGLAWIFLYVFRQQFGNGRFGNGIEFSRYTAAIPLLFFLAVEPLNFRESMRHQLLIRQNLEESIYAMQYIPDEIPGICPAKENCFLALDVMRKHRLGVFRDDDKK